MFFFFRMTIHFFTGNFFSVHITKYFVGIRNRATFSKQTSLKQLHFQNSHLFESTTFRNKYFFRTPSCLEQLCLSNNYYFSNTVNALKELRLQNRRLIKTHNFLKLPALPSSYFFRRNIFFSSGSFLLLLFF